MQACGAPAGCRGATWRCARGSIATARCVFAKYVICLSHIHPGAVKPGNHMATMAMPPLHLSDDDVNALAAYLEMLK